MAEFQTLYAIAEIAVAIAGFSAIVVLFKRDASGNWQPSDADRFNGMLIHSMSAAFFCVLPPIVAIFSLTGSTIWSVSSALLGVQLVGHAILIFSLPSSGRWTRTALVIPLGVALLQFLNVTEIHFSREFRPYLAGVLWHTFQAGLLFVALVWVRSSDTRRDA